MGRKALVAEDDPVSRLVLVKILEAMGLTVVACENGRLALEQVGNHPDLDLLVTDLRMPEMDGFDLITAIRERGDQDPLPILTVSGALSEAEMERLKNSGITHFLAKPVSRADLEAWVSGLTLPVHPA